MMRRRRFERGFTLLEVMVSVSIIAIVFFSVFRMHIQTLAMCDSVRFYSLAPMLAQTKFAELVENPSLESLSDGSGDFGADFPGYRWQLAVLDVTSEVLENTSEDLKQIDLSVSFEEAVYRLRTYRLFTPEG